MGHVEIHGHREEAVQKHEENIIPKILFEHVDFIQITHRIIPEIIRRLFVYVSEVRLHIHIFDILYKFN